VGFVRRGRNCGRPLGGNPSPVQRIELELHAFEAARGVEQEDGDQVAQSRFVEEAQEIPSSWATATASARRFTPSFS
jgi:hypothetical protein